MNTKPALCIGLGGVGREVLGLLRKRDPRLSLLGIDQLYPTVQAARAMNEEPRNGSIPLIGLASLESRQALECLEAWHEGYPWLPQREILQLIGELGPTSAAGYRFLGRLSLTRSHRLLDSALRRAIRNLLVDTGSTPEVILIASAEGGTGSAILADVSVLLRQFVNEVALTAVLILPPTLKADRARLRANAFATLGETFHIQKGIPWNLSLEGDGSWSTRTSKGLWKRIFVFEATEEEYPPYPSTVEIVAQALETLLDEEVGERRREVLATESEIDPDSRLPVYFSTCGGLVYDGFRVPALIQFPAHGQGSEALAKAENEKQEQPIPLDLDQEDQRLLAMREGLRELRGRKELKRMHGELKDIAQKIDPELEKLSEAKEERKAEAGTAGDPEDSKSPPLKAHVEDLRKLESRMERFLRFRMSVLLPVYGLFLLEQRLDLLRHLLERMIETRDGKSKEEKAAVSGAGLPDRAVEAEWIDRDRELGRVMRELEGLLYRIRTEVFAAREPSASRGIAVVLLPGQLPQTIERKALKAALEGLVLTVLGVECQTFDSKRDCIRIYFERNKHTIDEIRRLSDYSSAYFKAPYRELLHTHRDFLRMGYFEALEGGAGPKSLGPGEGPSGGMGAGPQGGGS